MDPTFHFQVVCMLTIRVTLKLHVILIYHYHARRLSCLALEFQFAKMTYTTAIFLNFRLAVLLEILKCAFFFFFSLYSFIHFAM